MQTVEEQTEMALERMRRVKDGKAATAMEAPPSPSEPSSPQGEPGDQAGPAGASAEVQPVSEGMPAAGAPSGPPEAARGDLALSAVPPPSGLAVKTPEWGVGDSWIAEYERMALRVATSVALPESLRGDGDAKASARAVMAIALAGRELGIGFMEATRQIDLINGATALRAELKMALARRAGLVVDEVIETATSCTIRAHRTDTGESGEGTFTEEDKKQAGLGIKDRSAWKTYPRDMLYARASARLLRRLMPDARGASFYSVEEVSEDVRE